MIKKTIISWVIVLVVSLGVTPSMAVEKMAKGKNGYRVSPPLLTIGDSLYNTSGELNGSTTGTYTPVGILNGIGAYELDSKTVRIFVNHELQNNRGNSYEVNDGQGGTFSMIGARVSYMEKPRRLNFVAPATASRGVG